MNKDWENAMFIATRDEVDSLRTLALTPSQTAVVRKAMLVMVRGIVFQFMCVIDGVADVDQAIPALALVDRETSKEISDQFFHDEFVELQPE